jgi:uncharacterized RDD family membrane protein YckC
MAALGITVLKQNVPWGPFTRAQIEEGLRRGDFTVQYLAHAPGLNEWLPLGEVVDYVEKSEAASAPLLPPVPGPRDFPTVAPLIPPPIPAPFSPPKFAEPAQGMPAPIPPPVPAIFPESSAVKPASLPEPHLAPASFFLRGFAFLIDCAILFIPVALIYGLYALTIEIPALWSHPSAQARTEEWDLLKQNMRRLLWLVAVGIGWLYGAGLESSRAQATIGKRWMGMKVTDPSGERISFLCATGRYAAKYLSALPCFLGFIAALFSSRRLALHDRLAGTRVVQR